MIAQAAAVIEVEERFMRIYLATAASLASLVIGCGGSDPLKDRGGNVRAGQGGASGEGSGGMGFTRDPNEGLSGSGGTMVFAGMGAGPDPDAGCGTSSVEAEQVIIETEMEIVETITEVQPVALYVMLDQSASMQMSGLWAPAKAALKAFVDDASSAGVDLALEYFPPLLGEVGMCTGEGYDVPAVAMGRLPDHAPNIHTSLDALPEAVGFGTPIEGALRGVTTFCKTFQADNPDEKCVAVLVTDGFPQLVPECTEDYAMIAQIAADAHAEGVTTFAVGLEGADFSLLDMIAMAGGAEDCSSAPDRFACDVSGGASQLVDALNNIRDVVTTMMTHTVVTTMVEETPLECEWEVPDSPDNPFDKMLVNVELSSPSGEVGLGLVDGEDECAARGWHYDDFEEPTRIIACEETCDLIQSTAMARIDILLGCETEPLE